MGLGGTAKKLQKITDAAEKLYAKMNEIIGELKALQTEVEDTSRQVDRVEREMAEQRALVEALADQQGIDTEAVLDEADLPPEPESAADSQEATTDGTGGGETPESKSGAETEAADAATGE